jgi:hypothetical protein
VQANTEMGIVDEREIWAWEESSTKNQIEEVMLKLLSNMHS